MHTLGRCRRRSLHTNRLAITTEFRAPSAPTRTRAMAWSTNDVISLSRRRTRRRGGPVARAMGVSLPRSRALLQFSPSFSRTALDFFGPPRGVVLTSSSSCRRKLESAKFLVPPLWRVLLILPKFSVVDEVQGAFLRRTDLQSRRADRSWKWQQLNARWARERQSSECESRKGEQRVSCYKTRPRNALMSGTSKKIAPACITSNALCVAFNAFAFGDELVMRELSFLVYLWGNRRNR